MDVNYIPRKLRFLFNLFGWFEEYKVNLVNEQERKIAFIILG